MLSPSYSRLIFWGLLVLIPLASFLGWSSREVWGGMLLMGFVFIIGLLDALDNHLPQPQVRVPWTLVFFLALLTTATITSTYRYASLVALLPYFAGVMLWALAQRYVIDERRLHVFSWVMVGSAALIAIHALSQVPALANLEVGVGSTFGWKNALAGFLALVGPVTVAQLGATAKRWSKMTTAAALTAIFGALFFTTSQAGWLALVVGITVVVGGVWFTQRRFPLRLLGWVAVAMVASSALVTFMLHLNNLQNPASGLASTSLERLAWAVPASTDSRLRYWATSAPIIAAFPLFGVGLGNFTTWYTHSFSEPWLFTISPHNYLIYLATSGGALTAAVFLWFLATRAKHAWRWLQATRTLPRERAELLHIGWIAGATGLFIHGLLDLSLEVPAINLLWWLALGLGIPAATVTAHGNAPRLRHGLRLTATAALIGLVFLIILADNRYQRALALSSRLGQVNQRLTLLEQSQRLMPLSANTAEALAAAHWDAVLERVGNRADNMRQALAAAQQAAALDPASAHRQWFLGRTYFLTMTRPQPAWPQVLYHLEQAIRYDFHDPTYYRSLAEAYLRLGWGQKATATIDTALALYPVDQLGKIFAGSAIYLELGLKEKLEDLQRLRNRITPEE